MRHEEILSVGSPVLVRSVASGVFVGRLAAGDGATVALSEHRWLRQWSGVGGVGSVHDLLVSDVRPQARGPVIVATKIITGDVDALTEEQYERLYGG